MLLAQSPTASSMDQGNLAHIVSLNNLQVKYKDACIQSGMYILILRDDCVLGCTDAESLSDSSPTVIIKTQLSSLMTVKQKHFFKYYWCWFFFNDALVFAFKWLADSLIPLTTEIYVLKGSKPPGCEDLEWYSIF